jgi:hypothetical protein
MIHGSSIIDYYGDKQDSLIPVAGPGHWNDPEIIVNMVILNLSEYSLIVFQNDSLNSFLLHFDRFEPETIDNRSDGFS